MCARRFLIFVFVLTLLFVAGAFAIFQFGQQVLIKQATPKGHFEAPPPRSGPDYAEIGELARRPGDSPTIPSRLAARRRSAAAAFAEPAAVFYIHPTTYLERDRWNAPLSGNAKSDSATKLFVQSQASAFNDAGAIWAPRYRQAAFGAFLLKSEDAQRRSTSLIATSRAAFDEFLERNPDGSRSSSPGTARARCTCCGCFGERAAAAEGPAGRRLCRRLAAQRRPPTCRRWACRPAARPTRPAACCRGMSFGRAGQPRPDHGRLGRHARARPASSASARTCSASTR